MYAGNLEMTRRVIDRTDKKRGAGAIFSLNSHIRVATAKTLYFFHISGALIARWCIFYFHLAIEISLGTKR